MVKRVLWSFMASVITSLYHTTRDSIEVEHQLVTPVVEGVLEVVPVDLDRLVLHGAAAVRAV